jgi:V-type H+-transporting ATPase subunit F
MILESSLSANTYVTFVHCDRLLLGSLSFFVTALMYRFAQIADDIRHLLDDYDKVIPTVLEIPSKNHPYDPTKDFMMTRIKKMMGVRNA